MIKDKFGEKCGDEHDSFTAVSVGRRSFFRSVLGSVLAVSGLSTTVGATESRDDQDDGWQMFQYDETNTGFAPGETGPGSDIEELWRFDAGNISRSSPAIVDGALYIETPVFSGEGLIALDASDGTKRWEIDSLGGKSAPAVVDGTVYVGSSDHGVYAVDAETGTVQWRFETGSFVEAPPTVVNETVYVGSVDDSVYALDASDGSLRWSFETGSDVQNAPAVDEGTVYVGSNDHVFYALDAADGTERWRFIADDGISASPTVADGTVFFGTAFDDKHVYALDKTTGEKRWSFETGHIVQSSPAVADGNVFVGSNDGTLYCLDGESGSEVWKFAASAEVYASPAVTENAVYASDGSGTVYALDREEGTELWNFEIGGLPFSSPAVSDGVVYLPGGDGEIYALSEERQIKVDIDIKPEDARTRINPHARGVIPVAVLRTDDFDPVEQIDVSTLRFGPPDVVDAGGGATPEHDGHVEDVDGDDDDDLVLHFPTADTGFDGDERNGKLVGETADGTILSGSESVELVGRGK